LQWVIASAERLANQSMIIMKTALVSAIVFFATAASGLAAAQAIGTPPTQVLAYSDLDLTAPDGAHAMLDRIRRAAADVCSRSEAGADEITRYAACYRASVAQAVTALHAPRVTEAYNARTGRRVLARLP
jgi:UrcA family protein